MLSLRWAEQNDKSVEYTAIEAFPPEKQLLEQLNYPEILGIEKEVFLKLHDNPGKRHVIATTFSIKLLLTTLQEAVFEEDHYHCIFFDAFSPEVQPEMWTVAVCEKMFASLKSGGVLTTYSAKGLVKRNLREAGFLVKRIPGPPGKREMLRAIRP